MATGPAPACAPACPPDPGALPASVEILIRSMRAAGADAAAIADELALPVERVAVSLGGPASAPHRPRHAAHAVSDRSERVLDLRARRMTTVAISERLGLPMSTIEALLSKARGRGDPRALRAADLPSDGGAAPMRTPPPRPAPSLRVEGVLDLRARRMTTAAISERLGLTMSDIEAILTAARGRGDPRALRAADLSREPAPPPAPTDTAGGGVVLAILPPRAAPQLPVPVAVPLDGLPPERQAAVRLRRALAERHVAWPHIHAHFMHLADLGTHHAGGYPSVRLKDGGEGLSLVRISVPLARSPVGSSAATCVDDVQAFPSAGFDLSGTRA